LSAPIAIGAVTALFQFFSGAPTPLAILDHLFKFLAGVVALFCTWHYWKGQNWGRIFVLLGSFVIVAREISALIDHDVTLLTLMSSPVQFLRAILAAFLLYWLNTAPVRAWFNRMSATTADLIANHLVGKLCTGVSEDVDSHVSGRVAELADRPIQGLRLIFEHDTTLALHCPFRIVVDDNLAFVTPAPLTAIPPLPRVPPPNDAQEIAGLLQNLRVRAVRVTPRTSDLFLTFEMGIELQTWSSDPDAHDWQFCSPALTVTAKASKLISTLVPPCP